MSEQYVTFVEGLRLSVNSSFPDSNRAVNTTGSNGGGRAVGGSTLVQAALIIGLVVSGPYWFQTTAGQRGLLAVIILGFLLLLQLNSPRIMISATLFYLGVMGGLRRWLIPVFGYSGMDPLLLVNAVLVLLFVANMLMRRRLQHDTPLSRLILALLSLMAIEVFNPRQGGIFVGLCGGLFLAVPLLWYYVGRQYGSTSILKRAYGTAIILAVLAGLYGLKQTWFGFSTAEQEYLRIIGASGLMVSSDVSRVFSFFTSSQEYATFLGIGVVALWGACLRGKQAASVPMAFLACMILVSSYRAILLTTLFTCTLMWAVQGRNVRSWAPRCALALVMAGLGLVYGLHQIAGTTFDSHTNDLVQHQTEILNPGKTDAGLHAEMVSFGFLEGFRTPTGYGLGFTTLASSKFGSAGTGTEFDISDVFLSLGCVGGILYLVIIGVVYVSAFRYWLRTRSVLALQMMGLLFLELGQWLHGDQSAATMLIWFSIGALDGAQRSSLAGPVTTKGADKAISTTPSLSLQQEIRPI